MLSSRSTQVVAVALVTAIVGCSAKMVSAPGMSSAPSPYAPVNEANRGGVIKYRNEGVAAIRQKRREDAYKQMFTACNGKYKIDAEGPREEGGVVVPVGNVAMVEATQYWYIQFSCVRDSADVGPMSNSGNHEGTQVRPMLGVLR